MNVIPVKWDEMKSTIIELGYVGENLSTQVCFECDSVFAEYPDAVPGLFITPPKGNDYPGVAIRDDNNVLWNVTSSDLANKGKGEVQLSFVVDNVVKKSATCRFSVEKSIMSGGEPPDPIADWLQRAEIALGEIPATIQNALEAAKQSGDFKGDPGYSPTVQITDITNGHRVTITDEEGTHAYDVLDGGDGVSPSVSTSAISGGTAVTITDRSGNHTFNVYDGVNGFSPDLTVTDIPNGHRITISDVSGTNIFDVMNGQQGAPGDPTQLIDDDTASASKTFSSSKIDEMNTRLLNDIQGMSESVEASDGFLEMNDLDAEVGGKTNTLITPYELTDMINNSIILSNGSIRTEGSSSDTSKMVTPLVEVVAGKTYGLKIHKRSTVGDIAYSTNYGYGLYASDGSTPVARSNQSSLGDDIYLFDIPQGAKYIRFIIGKGVNGDTNNEEVLQHFNQWILLPDADSTVDDSFFVITTPKENGEIDRIKRIDGSYLKLKDTQAREDVAEALAMPITFGRRTCAIFEKVCCIGDSYTAGYIYNSSGTPETNNKYSWVEHLKNMTGRDYVNCGISGATSKSWLSDADGLAKAQVSANKAQAYIIALQINDAGQQLTVGTVADIGTSADSYYGYTSKIIDEMFTINDDAHIFLLTQPKNYVSDHTPYRQAILDIVEWYQTTGNGTHQNQVHLIDLLDYWKLFRNPGCYDSSANGHYTAVGWEYTAEIIMYAWSNYLNAHPLLFQDVNLIPYGTT